MELLYLLVEDCTGLGKHKEISFTGQFEFSIVKYLTDTRELEIKISKQLDNPKEFFYENILNISAIIGENGTGKTTFLEFLRRLFSQRTYFYEKYLAIFRKDQDLLIFHTLYDFIEAISDDDPVFYENEWSVIIDYNSKNIKPICLYPWGIDALSPRINDIEELNSTKAIYYSGIFDLKGYPYPSSKGYIDISSNYLIKKDADEDDYTLPNKDVLLRHKHKNILRQIKLISSNLLRTLDFKVPERIHLVFELVEFNIDESRYINYRDKEIYNYFDKRINAEFSSTNKIIRNDIKSSPSNFNSSLSYKCKLIFVQALIKHFYKSIDVGSYYDSGTEIESYSYDSLSMFDAIKEFFITQKIVERDKIISLLECAYSIIDNQNNTASLDYNCSKIEVVDKESIVELLSYYEQYLNSFNNKTSFGFISTEWRDLSSGEKAFLDLFSRLYYAKDQILNEFESNSTDEIDTIYLLLDEAEIGFHPEWQRKYLFLIHEFLQYLFRTFENPPFRNTKVQVIIASHSPILISDLPKSNIIFLKKSEETLNIIKSAFQEQTFGANIHSLYSNSFILDCTIGEFSKDKISKIIKAIKEESSSINLEETQKLINIIGEPIVKNKLQNLLNVKLGPQKAIEWHKAQIAKLGGDI